MTVVFRVLIFLFISLTLPLISRIAVVMRIVSTSVCRIMCSPLVLMSMGLTFWMRTESRRMTTIMLFYCRLDLVEAAPANISIE